MIWELGVGRVFLILHFKFLILNMVKWQKKVRDFHSLMAPIVLLPLLVTVTTGVIYRLGKSWFGLSRDQVHFLMVIHEGEFFGQFFEPIYVLLNGLGLLWMLITGLFMLINSYKKNPLFKSLFTEKKSE